MTRGRWEDHLLFPFNRQQLINQNNCEKNEINFLQEHVASPSSIIALHYVFSRFNQSELIKNFNWMSRCFLVAGLVSRCYSLGAVMLIREICLTSLFLWAKPIILFICSCSQCVCGCVALSARLLRTAIMWSPSFLLPASFHIFPSNRRSSHWLTEYLWTRFVCSTLRRPRRLVGLKSRDFEKIETLKSYHNTSAGFSRTLNFDTTQFSC